MRRISRTASTYIVALAAFGFGAAWAAQARAQTPSNATGATGVVASLRMCSTVKGCPATVPSDFVLTPSGWSHPSCITPIHEDEVYDLISGTITRSDGTTRTAPPCLYPNYSSRGQTLRRFAQSTIAPATPLVQDWLANTENSASVGPVSYIQANWTVPPSPPWPGESAGFYYFPAVQGSSNLIQPVLGYNTTIHAKWTIQSWDFFNGTNKLVGDVIVQVSPGDAIQGYARGTNCSSTGPTYGVCSTWSVVTKDTNTGLSSTGVTVANVTESFGTQQGQVQGGVLEVAGMDICSQLAYPRLTFTAVTARDINGNTLSPSAMNWSDVSRFGIYEPECWVRATHVNGASDTTVTINWSLCGAPPLVAIESLLWQ